MHGLARLFAASAFLVTPAFAQTDEGEAAPAPLRPAPEYFLTALTDLNLAQALATQCETLSIDPQKATELTDGVLEKLEADGFDTQDPVSQMTDSGATLMALQQAFVDRHDLAGAERSDYCAAGELDLAADIGPGQYLTKIAVE